MLDVLNRIAIGMCILGVFAAIVCLVVWINPLLLLGIPLTLATLAASWLIGDIVMEIIKL